jgi:hypothetical protein
LPPSATLATAQKIDLLSDMDAQTLAQLDVGPAKIENVKAEGRMRGGGDASALKRELSMPVSELLQTFYGGSRRLTGRNRFEAFVRRAQPSIPYKTGDKGGFTLAPDATDSIYDAIRKTARMLIIEADGAAGEESLTRHDYATRQMAERFARFLSTGLAKGDAPWP